MQLLQLVQGLDGGAHKHVRHLRQAVVQVVRGNPPGVLVAARQQRTTAAGGEQRAALVSRKWVGHRLHCATHPDPCAAGHASTPGQPEFDGGLWQAAAHALTGWWQPARAASARLIAAGATAAQGHPHCIPGVLHSLVGRRQLGKGVQLPQEALHHHVNAVVRHIVPLGPCT